MPGTLKRRSLIGGTAAVAGLMASPLHSGWHSASSASVSGPKPLAEVRDSLERQIRQTLTDKRIPGAVVAIVDDRGALPDSHLITHGVLGVNDPRSVTADTAFDVGSCSKSYVATAVAALVSDGKLDFDERVKPHVPELELDDAWITDNITLRDILCNRTGLARQVPVESFANPDIRIPEIAGRLQYFRRAYPFRGGYVYFNPGFMIASLLVERVSGMPYAEFLEKRVFGPLGMDHSASGLRPFEILPDRARGHTTLDGETVDFEEPIYDNWQGAAGVFSCGNDALRWLRFHLGQGVIGGATVVDPAALKQLHRAHTVMPGGSLIHKVPEARLCNYCMGWWTSEFHGQRVVMHAGGMFGWRAFQVMVPGLGIGAAIYLNVPRRYEAALSYHIIETLLTGAARDWTAVADQTIADTLAGTKAYLETNYPYHKGTKPDVPLAQLAGTYRRPGLGDLQVAEDGYRLRVDIIDGRIWDAILTHLGGNIFERQFEHIAVRDYTPVPTRMRFVIESGQVVRLEDGNAKWAKVT